MLVKEIKLIDKPRRQAQILDLEQWKADRYVHTNDMIEVPEEEQLTPKERREIAEFNRQMAKVGLVLIPLAFILGASCVVAQVGIYMGWW